MNGMSLLINILLTEMLYDRAGLQCFDSFKIVTEESGIEVSKVAINLL